ITDGITGMEGNGPQWGSPRKLGVILASRDAVASDLIISRLVNYEQEKFLTFRAARDKGIGTTDINDIKFFGENLSSLNIVDFKKVPLSSLEFRIPSFIFGPLKDIFATKPSIDHSKCTACKLCMEICPARTITIKNNKIFIDYRNCIRCFCCQELCKEGAISVKHNWLSDIFK
ncbi:MAG: 4Fe-4S binding protein, partial [Candidatus Eremiobacterota bacterium]